LLIKGDHEVQRFKLHAELANPSDFQALSSSQFIFLAGDALYSFTLGAGLEVISKDGALWFQRTAGAILFASHQESGGINTISRYTPGKGIERIWASTKLVPAMVQQARDGLFLDVWGGGSRQIVYLPSRSSGRARVVWKEESSSLWK
jgi:hypothetical protein